MIITKKKFTALIEKEKSKAYLQGYERGIELGKREMLMKKVTPNDIRQAFGFPPLSKEIISITRKLAEKMGVEE